MSSFILTDECFKARKSISARKPSPLTRLACAKNDTAVFQLLIENGGNRCIVNPGQSPALTYEIGLTRYRIEIISNFPSKIYAEEYLPDEGSVQTADILYETPVTYDGDGYAPCLVELTVPDSASAGKHFVQINVYEAKGVHDETKAFDAKLELFVYDYRMPSPQEYKCHLDLWQHDSNVARTYQLEPWSDMHFAQLEKVVAALADLGQKSVTVLAADCPWRGWGCYLLKDHPATLFEYSPVTITKTVAGAYLYDFENLRRLIELYFSYGIQGDITVYGLMGIWTNMPLFPSVKVDGHPEQVLVRYLDESDGCYKYMTSTEEIIDYIRALFSFFRTMGVFEKVRIGADEPADTKAWRANFDLLRSIAPDVQFKMALDKDAAIEEFAPEISDIAASFPCSCKSNTALRKLREKDQNKRLLWYICNIPDKPNSVLHSELCETRALASIGYLFGFDGFLRWAFTCWTENPLSDIRFNNTALPAGDVNFIYPAKDGSLLLSVRYIALKKAIQDYELLLRLHEAGKSETAVKAVKTVLKNTNPESYMKTDFLANDGIFSYDYSDYESFRKIIFSALEEV